MPGLGKPCYLAVVAGTDGEQEPLCAEAGAERGHGCSAEVNTRKSS